MIEVKSSMTVKDYYYDDIAIQAFAARPWARKGANASRGMLKEVDLTDRAFSQEAQITEWAA